MSYNDKVFNQVADWVNLSQRILFFTGAGISTESGIPDFRSPGGLWEKFDPSLLTYQQFIESEENRILCWKLFYELNEILKDTFPNSAHLFIAEIEKWGKLHGVITQNVDNLHQQAGNSDRLVIELHGTMEKVNCLICKTTYNKEIIIERIKKGEKAPRCSYCSGILKPGIVLFGEDMPAVEMERAKNRAVTCDLCISIGSSLVVYPAAHIPFVARQQGARLVIINQDDTHADEMADAVLHGQAAQIMKNLIKTLY